MTSEEFRSIALSMPEASESAHMQHPDFRVANKIFATLGYPDDGTGMLKLTPEQQREFIQNEPAVFRPAAGAWGRRGSTLVRLAAADTEALRPAILMAWRNTATAKIAGKQRATRG